MAIWKYELEIADHQVINLPLYAEPLSAQMQKGKLVIWFQVDEENKLWLWDRRVCLIPTGQQEPEGFDYVSTVQLHNGDIVLHVYVERDIKPVQEEFQEE